MQILTILESMLFKQMWNSQNNKTNLWLIAKRDFMLKITWEMAVNIYLLWIYISYMKLGLVW